MSSLEPPGRPLLLADFDGVWTDPRAQAERVVQASCEALAAMAGTPHADATAAVAEVRAEVLSSPSRFGWLSEGRISAYADEDPYLLHNATMALAEQRAVRGDRRWQRYQSAAVAAGHAGLDELGAAIFAQASHRWLSDHGHDLVPTAVETMHALLEVADVLICTNFTTDAVESTWRRHGLTLAADAPLRVRGGARKQQLTRDGARSRTLAGRTVWVDREHYARILRQERPAIVAGDVLSLDLGLPIDLRVQEPAFRELEVLLVRAAHTPRWALDVAATDSIPIEVVDGLEGLRRVVTERCRSRKRG